MYFTGMVNVPILFQICLKNGDGLIWQLRSPGKNLFMELVVKLLMTFLIALLS